MARPGDATRWDFFDQVFAQISQNFYIPPARQQIRRQSYLVILCRVDVQTKIITIEFDDTNEL